MARDTHNVFDYGIKSARAVKLYTFGRADQCNQSIVQAVDDLISGGFLVFLL